MRDVIGPLLELLLGDMHYHDVMWRASKFSKQVGLGACSIRSSCVLYVGARLMGVVEPRGLGEFIPHEGVASADSLRADCLESNAALLDSLRPDEFGAELMSQTLADAELGRMTKPVPGVNVWHDRLHVFVVFLHDALVKDCGLRNVRLHPSFGIEQGTRPDGSVKVRPVDHYSWHAGHRRSKRRRKTASVNGHCLLTEKLTHDHVDDIVDGMASLQRQASGIRLQTRVRVQFLCTPGNLGLCLGCGNSMWTRLTEGCHWLAVTSGLHGLPSVTWNKYLCQCIWLAPLELLQVCKPGSALQLR